MKNLFWFVVLLLFSWNVEANNTPKPEKIYRIAKVQKHFGYYKEQIVLWEIEVNKDKTNAAAWLNYYTAMRVANQVKRQNVFDANGVAKEVAKHIPNTFEGNYIQYWNGRGQENNEVFLENAYKIDPNRVDIYSAFIVRYELERHPTKLKEFFKKWYDSGDYSNGIMMWNYNMLMSIEENAILLTSGDNDTYPIWMLQQVKSLRTDVNALNVWLLKDKKYQDKVFTELGIPLWDKDIADFTEDQKKNYSKLLMHYIVENAPFPVYFTASIAPLRDQKMVDKLYVVGLAYKYSKVPFDNVSVLKQNVEQRFLLDYLTFDMSKDISKTVIEQMNQIYAVPFVTLYKHYREEGNEDKMAIYRNYILQTSKDTDRQMSLMKHLEEGNKTEPIKVELNIKTLDKSIKRIRNGLYAFETEVMNQQYELFLMDLMKKREFDKLNTFKIAKTNWRELLPKAYQDLGDESVFKHGHPDEARMPVQGISHEAAIAYCDWLTNAYNQNTYKKKRYQKVKFRLPTTEEWEFAARGGHDLAPYPWGGYYAVNAKGCYLSNCNVAEKKPCEDCPNKHPAQDGGFFTVYGDAYFPNDYGLYNLSGNVAEMIDVKGIVKGGGWEDDPSACKVDSKRTYTGVSPSIGFRVFMEIERR